MNTNITITLVVFVVVGAGLFSALYFPAKKALETNPNDTDAQDKQKMAYWVSPLAGLVVAGGVFYYLNYMRSPAVSQSLGMYQCGCA